MGLAPAVVALLGLLGLAPAAAASSVAFSRGGARYEIITGRYGTLFPDEHGAPANHWVLALQTTIAGRSDIELVPGTDSAAVEVAPQVVLEGESDSLFLVWQSRDTVEDSAQIWTATYRDRGWATVVEVSGDPQTAKGIPSIEVVREDEDRIVAHVTWWEAAPFGGSKIYYTPLVFEAGRYLGWNPVVELDIFDANPMIEAPADADLPIFRTPATDRGHLESSIVIGAARHETYRILSFRIRPVDQELSHFADTVRDLVREASGESSESLKTLAERIRGHIVGTGWRMHDEVKRFLARVAYREIVALKGAPLEEVAATVREALLWAGSELAGREFVDEDLVCGLLHVGSTPLVQPVDSRHQFELCLVSDRLLPAVGSGESAIIVSESGRDLILAWRDETTFSYQQTIGSEFTPLQTLAIEGTDSFADAIEILRRSLR